MKTVIHASPENKIIEVSIGVKYKYFLHLLSYTTLNEIQNFTL